MEKNIEVSLNIGNRRLTTYLSAEKIKGKNVRDLIYDILKPVPISIIKTNPHPKLLLIKYDDVIEKYIQQTKDQIAFYIGELK